MAVHYGLTWLVIRDDQKSAVVRSGFICEVISFLTFLNKQQQKMNWIQYGHGAFMWASDWIHTTLWSFGKNYVWTKTQGHPSACLCQTPITLKAAYQHGCPCQILPTHDLDHLYPWEKTQHLMAWANPEKILQALEEEDVEYHVCDCVCVRWRIRSFLWSVCITTPSWSQTSARWLTQVEFESL